MTRTSRARISSFLRMRLCGPAIRDLLQCSSGALRYHILWALSRDPYAPKGIRTPVSGLRDQRPGPLDDGSEMRLECNTFGENRQGTALDRLYRDASARRQRVCLCGSREETVRAERPQAALWTLTLACVSSSLSCSPRNIIHLTKELVSAILQTNWSVGYAR